MIRHNLLFYDDFAFFCTKYAVNSLITLEEIFAILYLTFILSLILLIFISFPYLLKNSNLK